MERWGVEWIGGEAIFICPENLFPGFHVHDRFPFNIRPAMQHGPKKIALGAPAFRRQRTPQTVGPPNSIFPIQQTPKKKPHRLQSKPNRPALFFLQEKPPRASNDGLPHPLVCFFYFPLPFHYRFLLTKNTPNFCFLKKTTIGSNYCSAGPNRGPIRAKLPRTNLRTAGKNFSAPADFFIHPPRPWLQSLPSIFLRYKQKRSPNHRLFFHKKRVAEERS